MSTGHFLPGSGFRVEGRGTGRRWDYLLAGPAMAARFCRNGLVSLQAVPPAGRNLCESTSDANVPPLVFWIYDGEGEPFTHVLSPRTAEDLLGEDGCTADWLPGEVVYRAVRRGWEVRTVFRLDPKRGALLARLTVTNKQSRPRTARVVAAVATLNAPGGRHPWDPVGLYQRGVVVRERSFNGVIVENRDPGGCSAKRAAMGVFAAPSSKCVLADRSAFAGTGSWTMPVFAVRDVDAPEAVHGIETTAAFAWERDIAAGGSFGASLALTALPHAGERPAMAAGRGLLAGAAWALAGRRMESRRKLWEGALEMETPDVRLDAYATTWLPRQLGWVSLLDRGWATGLRGVRDAAQDFAAVAWIDPAEARDMIHLLFAAQREDGWFPRQVALPGATAGHDLRPYVDSGCWVVELLYDYLRLTGDRRILRASLPWLDGASAEPISAHLSRAVEYYIDPENLGPHGLALIRGGDWNDAIHLAGAAGRGESVMTSCQAVLALRQVAEILPERADAFTAAADALRLAIRRAALNRRGFLRGVCTDDGRWIFSERDPDGVERINAAVQAWGIIAGVFTAAEARRVLRMIRARRGPHGFRLFHPPLGDPPVPGVGRVASGDLMAGVAENGTVYNHGSQAFLARAASSAGDGDFLLEILHWALPCFTEFHPTGIARTPPYAMVNCWMETPGHDGEGGGLFLTGAVGVLRRVIIEGLLGFQPTMDGIRINPCLPPYWTGCRYALSLRGCRYEINVGKAGKKTPAAIPWGKGTRRVTVNIGGAS